MKTILCAKGLYIGSSALMCLSGAAMCLWPGFSIRVFCYALGALLLLFAAGKLTGYFSRDPYGLAFQFDLAMGIIIAVIGTVFLLYPKNILSILSVLVGLFVLLDAAFKVQTALDARKFGMREWWLILLGAVLSAVASGFLLFTPERGTDLLMRLAGLTLLMNGAQNLFTAMYTVRGLKNLRKERFVSVLEDEK